MCRNPTLIFLLRGISLKQYVRFMHVLVSASTLNLHNILYIVMWALGWGVVKEIASFYVMLSIALREKELVVCVLWMAFLGNSPYQFLFSLTKKKLKKRMKIFYLIRIKISVREWNSWPYQFYWDSSNRLEIFYKSYYI